MFCKCLRSRTLTYCVVTVLALGMLLCACGRNPAPSNVKQPIVFSADPVTGEVCKPPRTQVVPTLDTPIEPGKNVIWCASFSAAWRHLQKDIAGGPVQLDGATEVCDRLNSAPELLGDMAPDMFYAVAGWVDKGIIDTIHKEMAARFPTVPQPAFPDITPDSFLAYAYLCAHLPFTIPYFENDDPLSFTDSAGNATQIGSFGIRIKDDYAYRKLREQVQLLHVERGSGAEGPGEYVVDLCRDSTPNQIVIACVAPKETLDDTLQYVSDIVSPPDKKSIRREIEFGPNDALLVPNIWYKLDHRFEELEGKCFLDPGLKDQRMDVALQTIEFRLDRSGAELKSEAKMFCAPVATYYFVNRPFLIYMKDRSASRPFFVMWVDNAELLEPWPGK